MSIVTALDGVESILAIIKKGDATPEKKIEAILGLAETVRNDIQDLADTSYSDYVEELPPITFDMQEAVANLLVAFRKQEFNNLYSHYEMPIFADEKDPHVRMALASALVKLATELKRKPNPDWAFLIQTEGVIPEAVE